mgnify:CR=1 FL=1
MLRPDGQPRYAFVTFLMLNDNYLPGALVVGHGLRRQSTRAALICLVTDGVSGAARNALGLVFDRVLEIDRFYVPHRRRQERQDRPYFFTRLHALRLGADGDLGCDFEKIALIDADVLPMKHCDHLFTMQTPAGIINERKSHLLELDAAGRYGVPRDALRTGQWIWHQTYGDICPHGHPIPAQITDRVRQDPSNMGMNGSLFVLEPSAAEFDSIVEDVKRPEIQKLIGDLFDWPDMQYLTMRWSGAWQNIDLRFSALNGYPHLSVLFGTHFAGFKPWYFNRARAMTQYQGYDDFQRWFEVYREMIATHPRLREVAKLRRLLDAICRLDSHQ